MAMTSAQELISSNERATDLRASVQAVLIVFGFSALGVFMGLTAFLF